jgi:hypothetical protein
VQVRFRGTGVRALRFDVATHPPEEVELPRCRGGHVVALGIACVTRRARDVGRAPADVGCVGPGTDRRVPIESRAAQQRIRAIESCDGGLQVQVRPQRFVDEPRERGVAERRPERRVGNGRDRRAGLRLRVRRRLRRFGADVVGADGAG